MSLPTVLVLQPSTRRLRLNGAAGRAGWGRGTPRQQYLRARTTGGKKVLGKHASRVALTYCQNGDWLRCPKPV